MHQHFPAPSEKAAQLRPADNPAFFKPNVRWCHVFDWEVMPRDTTRTDLISYLRNTQHLELMVLDQGHDRVRTPLCNHIQVYAKISFPTVSSITFTTFAWAESDADQSWNALDA
jgi:hypothetical protein